MLELFQDTTNIRLLITFVMLAWAAFSDLKIRGVHDMVWVFGTGLAVISSILDYSWIETNNVLLTTLIVGVLSFFFYKFRIFALADMYGVIVTAFLIGTLTFSGNLVTFVTILVNSLLVSAVIFISNGIINSISILKGRNIYEGIQATKSQKLIAFFAGYRVSKPWFGFKMETTDKKFQFSLFHEEDNNYCKERDVWVSPSIPFALFLFIAFIIQLLYGDIILNVFMI